MSGSHSASSEDEEPRRPLRNRPVHALDRDDEEEELVVIESDEESVRVGLSQPVVGPSQSVSNTASMASSSTRTTQTKRSWVWSYFEQLPGGQQAKCLIAGCGSLMSVKSGSTKSLATHLAGGKKGHSITPTIHASLSIAEARASLGPGAPVQLTIEQSQAHVFKQDVFEKRLSEWIVLAQAPFETVDSDAFKELIRSLNKKARVHGPDTIKRRIMNCSTPCSPSETRWQRQFLV